jgi:hypothetical protein
MTDRQHSPRRSALDDTIDEVLREAVGGDRSVNVRARVLNRLGDGSAPGRSSVGLRWQSRWMVPAVGVAAVVIVAVVATLLVRGPSPSIGQSRIVAPGGTSAHRAAATEQPRDAQRSPGPVVSASAGGSTSVAAVRTHVRGGGTKRPGVVNGARRAWPAADSSAAEDDAPAIAIAPLTMDPLANPAPLRVPAIQIDPIVVPDIKIEMIEIKPLDAGGAPRPPDPGKPQQR